MIDLKAVTENFLVYLQNAGSRRIITHCASYQTTPGISFFHGVKTPDGDFLNIQEARRLVEEYPESRVSI